MTAPVKNILIIGGGFSGMSAAIQLRKQGMNVELVEIDSGWRSYGAGISLNGATLRAFRTLGILDEFMQQGFAGDGVELFLPDGKHLASLPTPRVAGPDIPGGAGIMRPALARILADATRAAGTRVRLGCTFTAIRQHANEVEVHFTDGMHQRYDLVIAADGLYSKVRETLFPAAAKPKYAGQGVWRAVVPRPAEVKNTMMWMGGKVKPGVNGVSQREMYLFVTEDRASNEHLAAERLPQMLSDLLSPFTAPLIQTIRAQITPQSQIIYRPLEGLLMPQPWYQGRVVMIGDTVHATTPHMAAGALIGIEDAIVLAEELSRAESLSAALERFQARRWERCRMVVENSARLCEIEKSNGDKQEHSRIMGETLAALTQPI
jgi:2-polyprenyl-6-methoxyphenol hydroxylase-like FAD-dependent oxidoreductase